MGTGIATGVIIIASAAGIDERVFGPAFREPGESRAPAVFVGRRKPVRMDGVHSLREIPCRQF
jgi:hypothetical protein